jgi:cell division protein ZapE
MDSFFASLQVPARRQHFHHFMRWVHQRLFQLTGTANPLQALAAELAAEVRVLCFDELFVSDIGDAMLLGPLLQVLCESGVVLVATSNLPPDGLYADGFNRERFLPAIEALKRHMQVVSVDGGADHRLHPGEALQRYWVNDGSQPPALAAVFAELNAGHPAQQGELTLGHRTLVALQYGAGAVRLSFAELCGQPWASADYIALCDRFPAILLEAVPQLGGAQRAAKIARGTEDGASQVHAGDRQLPALARQDDSVRRFIALVDECYDRRIPLYVEATVVLEQLYTAGHLLFPFQRTLSRLREMQTQRFG